MRAAPPTPRPAAGTATIYKPLDGVWHADEGQVRVIYTSPVEDLDDLLDPALGKTAHMFQEQIPKAFEARVTVVGSQVFAVRIDAGSPAARTDWRTDWRSDYGALAYSVIELPQDVAAGLVELHQRLGLVYGAADLICDDAGNWIFLETAYRVWLSAGQPGQDPGGRTGRERSPPARHPRGRP
jgi:glutathione synthase/RimK-type ligase-like ATP-grasp enzyme